MSTKFFTNKDGNSLFKKFQGVFKYQNVFFFDALVGYFRSSGYFKLRPFLEEVPEIRILVGINADKLIAESKRKGQVYLENPDKTKEEYLEFIRKDIEKAAYTEETEKSIVQFIEDIISGKLKIRAYGQKNLHSKIYIFRPENFNEHSSCSVITGSSNLTDSGMGTFEGANYEFNVLLRDFDDVKFATDEFEDLWKDANEIIPEDIQKLEKKTHLNQENITPYDLFLKMLIEYFGDSVIRDKVGSIILPEGYTNLQYQADAVVDGFNKMMKHNGFILADVVGLGKTVIATRIIKKYIDKNGYNSKILIIYPNAVETNWKSTIRDFGIENYVDFITNGSLHKVIDPNNYDYKRPEDYDLIVVDEAHKFRTSDTNSYGLLELICKTPRVTVGNDIDRRKKIMLITATPLNNKPEDIANQIYLFQDARKSTIEGVPNLQTFFSDKIEAYKKLRTIKDHKELVKEVKKIYLPIREKVFAELMIRRTRADIRKIERYKKDVEEQGMTFPDVIGPNKIEYAFSDFQEEVFFETIEAVINKIGYYRYRAIEFINPEYAELYENATLISRHLAGIRKTQLVKRLESSFFAFKQSLKRFYISNERMIQMFENDKVYVAPDIDVNKYLDDDREEDLEAKIEELNAESPNNQIYKADDFSKELLVGLKQDQAILKELVDVWKSITDDPKLDKFLNEIEEQLFDKRNVENKLVIFSESTETVNYLAEALKNNGRNDVLAISAKNNKRRFKTIRRNFDANYKKRRENKYNIIITTEVLAEGINLHRSNVILNYDIPWNSTKLMQRIGRVNRIGTKADNVYVYNFYPTSQSNTLIKLNEKSLKKLQGFHSALSEDSKIYSEEEQLIENTLGDLQPQEEVDERLQYLEMIRNLYEDNFKEYKRIKKLPIKSRIGREAQVNEKLAKDIVGESLSGAVLCYLRNKMKEGFYVADQKLCVELTFYQAVKLFQATKEEKGLTIQNNHYAAVKVAIDNFSRVYNVTHTFEEYDRTNLSVQERNAVKFLNSIKSLRRDFPQELSEEFIELVDASLRIIYLGVFRKFRMEIAKLAREQRKKKMPLAKIIQKLNLIMNNYPISSIARLDALRNEEEENSSVFEEPTIVLTETFE